MKQRVALECAARFLLFLCKIEAVREGPLAADRQDHAGVNQLHVKIGAEPNTQGGTGPEDRPPSFR
jgi:hypothetical protein